MSAPKIGEIAACVFDAYGTLFDVTAAARKCAPLLDGKAEALAEIWRTKQLEYTWLRSLMGRYADFWHVTGDALDFAMDSLGLEDPALRARLMQLYLELDAYPEVPEVLGRLKEARIRRAILSNGSTTMLTAAVKSARLSDHLDKVLSVDPVETYKPRPVVYELATEWAGADPYNILFLSSNGWDVAGAAAFGFRVVWINRRGAPRERLPGHPELEMPDLNGLPDLLGA